MHHPGARYSFTNPQHQKIAETELVFKLAPLGSGQALVADKRLLLLHLICLFLVFRLKCCNGFSLKLTGLMCDGRAIASPLFRRLAGPRRFFFSGFDGFYAWWRS